jgi:hypothetical protein
MEMTQFSKSLQLCSLPGGGACWDACLGGALAKRLDLAANNLAPLATGFAFTVLKEDFKHQMDEITEIRNLAEFG